MGLDEMKYSYAKYTVITRAGFPCPWCDKAAELLDEKGLRYNLRPLKKSDLREAADHAEMSTVPIIYHGVRLVGGYAELKEYLNNG